MTYVIECRKQYMTFTADRGAKLVDTIADATHFETAELAADAGKWFRLPENLVCSVVEVPEPGGLAITEHGREKVKTANFTGLLRGAVAEMAATGANDVRCLAWGLEFIWWTLVGEPTGHQPDAISSLKAHYDEVRRIAATLDLDDIVRRATMLRGASDSGTVN